MAKLAILVLMLSAVFGTVTAAKTGDVVIEYPPTSAALAPAVSEDAVTQRLMGMCGVLAAAFHASTAGDISDAEFARRLRQAEPALRSIEWDAGNLYARQATGSTFWLMLAARDTTDSLLCWRRGVETDSLFLMELGSTCLKGARSDMELRTQERAKELGG
jgi:hypothetical protein